MSSRVRSRVFADVLRRTTNSPITSTTRAAAPAPMYTINKEESLSFVDPPVAVSPSSEEMKVIGEGEGEVQETVQLLYLDP